MVEVDEDHRQLAPRDHEPRRVEGDVVAPGTFEREQHRRTFDRAAGDLFDTDDMRDATGPLHATTTVTVEVGFADPLPYSEIQVGELSLDRLMERSSYLRPYRDEVARLVVAHNRRIATVQPRRPA